MSNVYFLRPGAPCYLTKFRDSCRHNSFTYAADRRCPERPASATTTHKRRFVITTSLAGRLFGMQFLLLSRAASTRRISELPCRLSGTKNHHFAKLRFHDFQRMLKAQPQLALIKPKIYPPDEYTDTFSYTYDLQGLDDYDNWYLSCVWNYTGGIVTGKVTGALGAVAKDLYAGYQYISSIFTDVGKRSIDTTANTFVDSVGDEILPIWSFLRKLNALGDLPIDSKNGPCSEKV
ncbi:hypothetical protein BJAS_P0769 [Bathymodiolus japonicus methanotrophic gill symbiont]|nr:hypothetical protein BJAS_P0769 [Bathymodiolus japonicus methanotrophic gill symbiont]